MKPDNRLTDTKKTLKKTLDFLGSNGILGYMYRGNNDKKKTMIYTYVLGTGDHGVRNPIDKR